MLVYWDKRVIQNDETVERDCYFYDLLIKDVKGYKWTGKDKLKKVPPKDRLEVINKFIKVKPINVEDVKKFNGPDAVVDVDDDYIVVYTIANQNNTTHLQTHIFKQPSMNDFNNYQRASSMVQSLQKSHGRIHPVV
jgi:hypothetical protein